MMLRALLVALALLAAPGASAALTITAEDEPLALPPGTTTELEVTGTLSCQDFIAAGSQSIDVTLSTDAPAEWGPADGSLSFTAGADCISGSGSITQTGTVSFTPNATALGLVSQKITVTASGDAEDTYQRNENMWVAYAPGHTLETSIEFPYALEGDKLTFNVTVNVDANTDTMVMFENITTTAGSVSGLSHERFFFTKGEDRSRVKTVTWEPPTGAWDNATITFYNYSHCLIFEFGECDPQVEDNISWTITNAQPAGNGDGETDGDKDSPGVGFVAILALVGAALVLRRR